MSESHTAAALKTWAGALVAPIVWFLQQQLVYWRLPDPCGGESWGTIGVWLLCAAVVIGATVVSLHRIRVAPARNEASKARDLFTLGLAVVMPILFLIPMTWQAIGGLLYSGCER